MIALTVASRMLFAFSPGFKPVSAMVIICGMAFGRESGFLCGSLSAVVSVSYTHLDVYKRQAPDAVIHCAAYTAVDAAEDNEEICRKVNAQGTENIAKVCEELDIKMMYISTDYVFNGQGERPWEPDDKREPLNVYGQTKYEGELAIEEHVKKFFTVRIAWVFGVNGKNFIKTMLNLGKTHDHLTVVNDQTGSPTYTYDPVSYTHLDVYKRQQ